MSLGDAPVKRSAVQAGRLPRPRMRPCPGLAVRAAAVGVAIVLGALAGAAAYALVGSL